MIRECKNIGVWRTLIVSRASSPKRPFAASSVIPKHASFRSSASEKNHLWSVWLFFALVVRPQDAPRPRPLLRRHPRLSEPTTQRRRCHPSSCEVGGRRSRSWPSRSLLMLSAAGRPAASSASARQGSAAGSPAKAAASDRPSAASSAAVPARPAEAGHPEQAAAFRAEAVLPPSAVRPSACLRPVEQRPDQPEPGRGSSAAGAGSRSVRAGAESPPDWGSWPPSPAWRSGLLRP